jgi:hypothetical protein
VILLIKCLFQYICYCILLKCLSGCWWHLKKQMTSIAFTLPWNIFFMCIILWGHFYCKYVRLNRLHNYIQAYIVNWSAGLLVTRTKGQAHWLAYFIWKEKQWDSDRNIIFRWSFIDYFFLGFHIETTARVFILYCDNRERIFIFAYDRKEKEFFLIHKCMACSACTLLFEQNVQHATIIRSKPTLTHVICHVPPSLFRIVPFHIAICIRHPLVQKWKGQRIEISRSTAESAGNLSTSHI